MKQWLLGLLCLFCVAVCLANKANAAEIVASGYCGKEGSESDLSWSIDENNVLTICGTGEMQDYGDQIDREREAIIRRHAPWTRVNGYTPEVVIIEEGVTSIGQQAFQECGQVKSVSIPGSVTEIKPMAFYQLSFLADVTFHSGALKDIGNYAFSGCDNLASIMLPEGMTHIGRGAFYGCGMQRVYIPSTVEIIEKEAFNRCLHLAYLYFPNSLSFIGENCFYINIREIHYAGNATDWQKIEIESGNENLNDASFYYYDGAKYFVTFWGKSGLIDGKIETTIGIKENDGYALAELPNNPVRSDHLFDGWYSEADGGEEIILGHVFARHTYVYAHWIEGHTVCLMPNGGTLSGGKAIEAPKSNGYRLDKAPEIPERAGYEFTGWYTKATEGNEISLSVGEILESDMTVYAQWHKDYHFRTSIYENELQITSVNSAEELEDSTPDTIQWILGGYLRSPRHSLLLSSDGTISVIDFNRVNETIYFSTFSNDFQLCEMMSIPFELRYDCGFYAGKDYNYVIFGQNNHCQQLKDKGE